ncbi:glycosyltransferase family 2 protein [Candidatus Pelagibacter sp. Uisw_114]
MQDKYLISVIVPFYNAEQYIENCIEVLTKQIFEKPYEIVMINDASTDRSTELVKKYNFSNISLHSLASNSGPAAARNLGLKKAKGQYIYFFDVDDFMDINALKILYDVANETDCDLVFSDRKWIENSINIRENKFIYSENKYFDKTQIVDAMKGKFCNPLYSVGLFQITGRLIKRSIISNNNLYFEEKLRYLEDEAFEWDLLGLINNATYLKKQLYTYNLHNNSNTAISEGLTLGFPISNFKIVENHIGKSLNNCKFSSTQVKIISQQGFIFLIISALVSYSRSILLGKINLKIGIKSRLEMIKSILDNEYVKNAIKNYIPSKNESIWIVRGIKWRSC